MKSRILRYLNFIRRKKYKFCKIFLQHLNGYIEIHFNIKLSIKLDAPSIIFVLSVCARILIFFRVKYRYYFWWPCISNLIQVSHKILFLKWNIKEFFTVDHWVLFNSSKLTTFLLEKKIGISDRFSCIQGHFFCDISMCLREFCFYVIFVNENIVDFFFF